MKYPNLEGFIMDAWRKIELRRAEEKRDAVRRESERLARLAALGVKVVK